MLFLRSSKFCLLTLLIGLSGTLHAQQQPAAPVVREAPSANTPAPAVGFDSSSFLKLVPPDQLAWLAQSGGMTTHDLLRDKRFHKAVWDLIPDPMFHYGKDMTLQDAMELLMKDSAAPLQVRDGRYITVNSARGPILSGRAMIWVDIKQGIVLGAFYFHPGNGEPTPVVVVVSKQLKQTTLQMSELPDAFAEDLAHWSQGSNIPRITTRYFIGDVHKKILLEHDEDYCAPADGYNADSNCEQQNADAADIDMTAAYYLEDVHYATNATAYMAGPQQGQWLQVRTGACGVALACRTQMTREHVRVIMHQPPAHPRPAPPRGRR